MLKTDLEIAQECKMEHIHDIAAEIGVGEEDLKYYSNYEAGVSLDLLHRNEDKKDGELTLVTATNPTEAGEGRSTTTVGLGDASNRMRKKATTALREPSLGPVFDLKGGATGSGYAQVVPMKDISPHFTGDMHAITTANNLVSVCLDNHIHRGNELDVNIENITWRRCLDMNDRTLRHIVIGQGSKADGVERVDGFNITATGEMMAVLCLSTSLMDLKERLGSMLVTFNSEGGPIYVKDLGIEGVLVMVMEDAIKPDMVQTPEHDPILIHDGLSANIAHGCSSILTTRTCLKPAGYTVTETGFGADPGAEKFLDIKCRSGGLKSNAVVIVATIRALKQHGNVAYEGLKDENVEAMLTGCENLAKHTDTVKQSGLPYIVAINGFASDIPAEVEALQNWCKEHQHPMSFPQVWVEGREGALDLANQLAELCAEENSYASLYDVEQSIEEKITAIMAKVYGAEEMVSAEGAKERIALYISLGWDRVPIYMAKTQISLSDDAKVCGVPKNFTITVYEPCPSLSTGFPVVLTGKVPTMPGLPKTFTANNMDIDEKGHIEGLF